MPRTVSHACPPCALTSALCRLLQLLIGPFMSLCRAGLMTHQSSLLSDQTLPPPTTLGPPPQAAPQQELLCPSQAAPRPRACRAPDARVPAYSPAPIPDSSSPLLHQSLRRHRAPPVSPRPQSRLVLPRTDSRRCTSPRYATLPAQRGRGTG